MTERPQTSRGRVAIPSNPASDSSRAWLWYGAGVGLYALVFYFWQVEPVPFETYIASVLLWAVALGPLAVWYGRGRGGIPIFELICVAYGASYGPPVFLVPNQILSLNQQIHLSWSATFQCTLLTVLGLGVLISAYYSALIASRNFSLARVDLPLEAERQSLYITLALVCGLAMSVALSLVWSAGSGFSAIFNLLAGQYDIGLVLLAYEVYSARTKNSGRMAMLYVCTGIGVLLGLTGGMLESVVLPIILVLIVRWHVRKKFPIAMGVFVALLFLMLNPLKQEYRERVWYGEFGGSGLMQKLGVWAQLARERLGGAQSEVVEGPGGFQEAMGRLDLIHKFAHVKTLTPAEVPFLDGLSYRYMLYTYIPRIFWAEKPVATDATDLVDYAYGFRSPQEESKGTKIAIGQIAEAYANLGWKGIVMVMFLQGIFFAVLNHVLNGPHSIGGRAIYLSVMVAFLNGVGTSAVILFGATVQFLIASAVLMRPFAGGFSAKSARSPLVRRSRRKGRGENNRASETVAPELK